MTTVVRMLAGLAFGVSLLVGGASAGAGLLPAPATSCRGTTPASETTVPMRQSTVAQEQTVVNGVVRTYRIAVPRPAFLRRPLPLLFDFHGFPSNALIADADTGLSRRGSHNGFLVVTPNGLVGGWNLRGTTATNTDLQFVSSVIAELNQRFCLDPGRVYVTGKSQGAAFSIIAACALRQISAAAVVAVEFPFQPCPHPVPLLAFHGTADPLVPFGGGRVYNDRDGEVDPGTSPDMARWAAIDGCRSDAVSTSVNVEVRELRWQRCAVGGEVVLFTIVGAGHTWPGSPLPDNAATGRTTHALDATAEILRYFTRHPRMTQHQ